MSTVIIVQARMASTRLPGKVLKPILGRPMLSYQIERLRRARRADRLVIATTVNDTDEPIAELCKREGVACFRGPEDDVLSRYAKASERFGADTVVRVTSDCPLIDPELADAVIGAFIEEPGGCDYASNDIEPGYPTGLSVEVFSARVLHEADSEARDPQEREHVTPFIYWRPERYRLKSLVMRPDLSHHRWTVDTPEDFELVSRIVEALYPVKPRFVLADVLELLSRHPEWERINRHVTQRRVAPPSR